MNPDKKYPVFYAKVQKLKNKNGKNKEIKSSETKYYNCPMDILYQIIRDEVIDLRKYPQLQKKKLALIKSLSSTVTKQKWIDTRRKKLLKQ